MQMSLGGQSARQDVDGTLVDEGPVRWPWSCYRLGSICGSPAPLKYQKYYRNQARKVEWLLAS